MGKKKLLFELELSRDGSVGDLNDEVKSNNVIRTKCENFKKVGSVKLTELSDIPFYKRTKEQKEERKELLKQYNSLQKQLNNSNKKISKLKKEVVKKEKDFEKGNKKLVKQVEKEFKKRTKTKQAKCELIGHGGQGYAFKVSYYDEKEKKNKEVIVKKTMEYDIPSFNDGLKEDLKTEGIFIEKHKNEKGIIQPILNEHDFLVTEVAGNTSLRSFLQTGKMDMDSLPRIMNDLYAGLNNIHDSGSVHNDLAQRNIVIDTETHKAKIIDLGCMGNVPANFEKVKENEKLFLFNTFKECYANSLFGPETPENKDRIKKFLNSSNVDFFNGYIESVTADGLLSKTEAEEIKKDFTAKESFAQTDKLENVFNILNTRTKNKTREEKKDVDYKTIQRGKDILRELKHQDKTASL
ncbi:MAG: hypothetical protein Ta2D_01590 [Rickettsiales bacterium]|nr:MAG: hypothetical protein Ta2D_01590 [Rickettsiales bacterium]